MPPSVPASPAKEGTQATPVDLNKEFRKNLSVKDLTPCTGTPQQKSPAPAGGWPEEGTTPRDTLHEGTQQTHKSIQCYTLLRNVEITPNSALRIFADIDSLILLILRIAFLHYQIAPGDLPERRKQCPNLAWSSEPAAEYRGTIYPCNFTSAAQISKFSLGYPPPPPRTTVFYAPKGASD